MKTRNWNDVSACAACLRGIALTRRYARYQHGITRLADALDDASISKDVEAARAAYIDLQNLCNHTDALDAEIHRAILNCLNRAMNDLWPTV